MLNGRPFWGLDSDIVDFTGILRLLRRPSAPLPVSNEESGTLHGT